MTWASERYFAKAQLYWSRASGKERSSEEFLLGIAFACEFMIRGALCHANPALNAASDNDSILFAAGVAPERPPRTIEISAGWRRLMKMIPSITEAEGATMTTILDARNRELHGDEDVISQLSQSTVMPHLVPRQRP